MKTQEEYALEKVVDNLKQAVLLQEKRMGYIYWRHKEKELGGEGK